MRVCARVSTNAAGDWIDVSLRKIGAFGVAVLALAGLSACETKAGAAAVVDGNRINQSDVNKYVDPAFTLPTPSGTSQAQEPPRIIVLNTIIEDRLMTALLKSKNAMPSDAELHALHDEAFAVQLNIQQTGTQADDALRGALDHSGLRPGFADVFVRGLELKQAVIDKIQARQQSDIADAVKKLDIPVSVNGRYGSWSAKDASLVDYAPPDFIKLGTPTATSNAPSPG